jgi:predicted CopG family antitoxin
VKNITVSVPEDVYRRARIKAAERDSSVSALVKEFLTGLGREESDLARGKRLQDEVLATIRRFRGGNRLTRDAVHRRRAVR